MFVEACEAILDRCSNFQFDGSCRHAMDRCNLPMWLTLDARRKKDCSPPCRQLVHNYVQSRQCVARYQDRFGTGPVILDIHDIVDLMRMKAAALS